MRVDAFDFELPDDLIATQPASPRDSARLLHVPRSGDFYDRVVRDLPQLLRAGDTIVFNDTKVIPARLFGYRGEARIEFLLHKSLGGKNWSAFAKPAKKLKLHDVVVFAAGVEAVVIEKFADGQVGLAFRVDDVFEALELLGEVPLPPYMKRKADAHDTADYQTVYAQHKGSVAAPTAGLHFTPALLRAIDDAGVTRAHITLHVGGGTFLPVKVEDTKDHVMHAEWARVDTQTARQLNETRVRGGRIIAVGTTSMRTLESAVDAQGLIQPMERETNIFITPGYQFKAVDALMTNFHLPKSTLMMLVSAFAGYDRMRAAYAHAISKGYRFYSYGDSSFLERAE